MTGSGRARRIGGLALLLVLPAAAAAQGTAALEQAEARLAAGDIAEARRLVDGWWRAAPAAGGGLERARALALRARLSGDPDAAQQDWLALVLGYPASSEAPAALLRLGQLLHARGEAERASAYLARLLADYPGHPLRAEAFLWLARVRRAGGQAEAACSAVADGLAARPDVELRALLSVEQARCPLGTRPARAAPAAPASEDPTGDWSVQAGAYRSLESAAAFQRVLARAGYTSRVVRVPGSALVRVRVGRFASATDASALRARLAAAGLEAVVVDDVASERPAR